MPNIITSDLLSQTGLVHGFTMRGGDSNGVFGQFNIKADDNVPDSQSRVEQNRRELIEEAGGDPDRLVFLNHLPHGNTVYEAHEHDAGEIIDGYDTIVTREDLVVGLAVADCVPLLIYDFENNVAGIVHAGWRGSQAKAAMEAIKYLENHFKTKPENLVAVLGPSICGKCYEVSDDVASLFDETVLNRKNDKICLDLRQENIRQLRLLGVEKIDDLDVCTAENTDKLFSHRREGQTGRFMAFISPKKDK